MPSEKFVEPNSAYLQTVPLEIITTPEVLDPLEFIPLALDILVPLDMTPLTPYVPDIKIKIIGARLYRLLLDSRENCCQYFTQPQVLPHFPVPLSSFGTTLKAKSLQISSRNKPVFGERIDLSRGLAGSGLKTALRRKRIC